MIKIMKLISKKELGLTLALLVLVFVLCNPFGNFMPSIMDMVVLALLVVVVGLFAGFVVNEKVIDERELEHRAKAGRSGYTAGLVVDRYRSSRIEACTDRRMVALGACLYGCGQDSFSYL
jgi:hypothetical protein